MPQSMTELRCAQCNKLFLRRTANIKQDEKRRPGKRQFCSHKCQYKGQVTRLIKGKCAYCGKRFKRIRSGHKDKGIVCSKRCGAARAVELQWRDKDVAHKWCKCGRKTYSKGGKRCGFCEAEYRAKVTKGQLRAEYSISQYHAKIRGLARLVYKDRPPCEACGYDLHVDICHVRDVADFPDDATVGEINDPANLVALDKRCHWEFDHGYLKREDDGTWVATSPKLQLVAGGGLEPTNNTAYEAV